MVNHVALDLDQKAFQKSLEIRCFSVTPDHSNRLVIVLLLTVITVFIRQSLYQFLSGKTGSKLWKTLQSEFLIHFKRLNLTLRRHMLLILLTAL